MVEITNIEFKDEYSGSGASPNPFIMGSIADKLIAYVSISVHWESLQVQAIFNSTNKTIKRNDNYSFIRDGFKKGDSFEITGTTAGVNDGTFTIDTITDSTITTIEAIPSSGVYSLVDFNGLTQVNALNFYYNLIENNSPLSFISLTDNQSVQKFVVGKSNWVATETVNFEQATTSIGWQTSQSGTCEKLTDSNLASNYTQTFLITQPLWVVPLYLSGDLVYADGKLVPPPYFNDTNSLKYVTRIDARFNTVNPSIPHTTSIDYEFDFGNIGWFDEFLNGGVPEYSLVSIVYTDFITGDVVDSLQINRETIVTCVVSSTNGRFTGSAQQCLNFFYCPDDQRDYVDTRLTDLLDNFRFDHKLITSGGVAVNGINYGTDYQALTKITSVNTTANLLTVTFSVDFSSATQTLLEGKDATNRKYILSVTPQKEASTYLGDTDRNAVLVAFDIAMIDLDDATLLTFQDTEFFQYPETTTNASTDFKGFIGDYALSRSKFIIDGDATPQNIKVEILAYNNVTEESFVLQTYSQQFPESELQGLVCDSNLPQVLNYKLASDDLYNQVYLYRTTALDTATHFGWAFDYGFVMRYEQWRNVPEYATAFACNHTQDWSIYSLLTDWDLKFLLTVNVELNDNVTTFERISSITLRDDSFADDGFGGTIVPTLETFYTNGSGTLVDAHGMIFIDQDTHVKLTFVGDFSALPGSAIGYSGYLALDIENEGGEFTRELCVVQENVLETSPWMDGAFLEKVDDNTITIEGDLDYTKLDIKNKEYLLTGRLRFKY